MHKQAIWFGLLTALLLLPSIALRTNAQTALPANAIEIKATETAKLKELLERQTISALLADGTSLQGKVKAVSAEAATVNVAFAKGPSAFTKGEHAIALASFTTINITKYQGKKRAILATALGVAGAALGLGLSASEFAGESLNGTYAGVIVAGAAGGAAAGYAWGRALDKKTVTLVIRP